MAHPHSSEELALLSTIAHNIIGWLLLAIAMVLLIEARRGEAASRWRYLWPGIGIFFGFGLTSYLFFHFLFYHRVSPFIDSAQNQHQVIGLIAGAGGLIELIRRRRQGNSPAWRAAWPLALVGVGVAFLIHEQGTTEALLVHWALAATLILAGLALMAGPLSGENAKALSVFGILLLATASLQLIVFVEKPGAHVHPPAVQSMEHGAH
jgi:uncharacterized membrane protein HdeD (DUF308 family)